jgi:type II secretory pathway pseudopilin PulG
MRLRPILSAAAGPSRRRSLRAFTIAELMVTMTIVLLVMGGLLSAHFFGLRLFELTKAKLGASDEARAAISTLIQEIRSAKLLRIGDGSLATFTEVGVDSLQKGSAIQVYATSNTNLFVRYFWDAADKKLKRTTNGATYVSVVANSISNQLVFTSEDYTGKILTNNENNRVIGLTLQFYQLQYPAVSIGPGNYYDFYQLSTKITRRTLE